MRQLQGGGKKASTGSLLWQALLIFACLLSASCGCKSSKPVVTFTTVPENSMGGVNTRAVISGRVSGSRPGDQVMIFAHSGGWWVQPDVHAQFTQIAPDGTWTNQIHLGTEYSAALIRGSFEAKESDAQLPVVGRQVLAIATVAGTPTLIQTMDHTSRVLRFGGYDWEDTFHVGDHTGKNRYYLPQNAEVDARGAMHLQTRSVANRRTCSEVTLPRTLGYGTYRLTFESPVQLDPAAEFSFYTYSPDDQADNHRKMELNLSRWGDVKNRNAEYVVEPYYVPANVHIFELGAGRTTTILRWSPGRAQFSTTQKVHGTEKEVTSWNFTAGVPTSKDERVYLSLCPFGYPKNPMKNEVEIILNSFEFLP